MAGFEEHDVSATLAGLFELNAKVEEINGEVRRIRIIMENGDEEEEEEPDADGR